jgi:hypothetical protein
MVIIREKKDAPMESTMALVKIAGTFARISSCVSQIETTLSRLQFRESYFHEGSQADRKFVKDRIIALNRLLQELDDIRLSFISADVITSFEQKQQSLRCAQDHIQDIRSNMLSIWDMRKSGDTQDDRDEIERLSRKMFIPIRASIRAIFEYVSAFNKLSARKLSFKVTWTPLPK